MFQPLLDIFIKAFCRPVLDHTWMVVDSLGPSPEIRRLFLDFGYQFWMQIFVLALRDQPLDQAAQESLYDC